MSRYRFERLAWDSGFFGRDISRLNVREELTSRQLEEMCGDFEGDLLYFFSDREQAGTMPGMKLVDRKVIYTKDLKEGTGGPADPHISAISRMSRKLFELACLSGQHSRFKLDAELASRFTDMYRLWIERSVDRQIADEVLGYFEGDREEPSGFVSVKKSGDTAVVGLIAVDEARQGKKIGQALMQAAEEWAMQNRCSHAEVATQLDNTQACRFYIRCGYHIKDIQYIYHYHKHLQRDANPL
jgi:dTDP-4-amino-4,6-dideoxy-D-galactose acyltransferase